MLEEKISAMLNKAYADIWHVTIGSFRDSQISYYAGMKHLAEELGYEIDMNELGHHLVTKKAEE